MIIINGKKYNSSGKSISIINGHVTVDGKELTDLSGIEEKEIKIEIQGDIDVLDVDHCQQVSLQSCGSVKTMSGSVKCQGDIEGSVNTMSGSVKCGGEIKGSVSSMSGSIKSIKK